MGDKYPKLKVAAVQAVPVFLDREASVEKSCDLIREAAKNGANLVVFPEGFIPTHPVWYHFHVCTDMIAHNLSVDLFKNSVEVPGEGVKKLCRIAGENNIYVIMGICEKLSGTTGTMYNSQIIIGSNGRLIGKHQKIRPTVGERIVHKEGSGVGLTTFITEFGTISALMCSENYNPLAIMALVARGTLIHAMSWPNFWGKLSLPMRHYVSIATYNFAQVAQCFVISACSVTNEDMLEKLHLSSKEKDFLRQPEYTGGSLIVGPDAKLLAGPMGNEEGIIYADIDIEECVKGKLDHDFAGHYNREDIFQLFVNKSEHHLVNEK